MTKIRILRNGRVVKPEPSAKQLAKRAISIASRNKPEVKVFDQMVTSQTFNGASPYVGQMNAIPQGDDKAERDGNQVKMLRVAFQGYVNTAVAVPQMGRVALVLDKQPNAATPSYSDIFDGNFPNFKDQDHSKRFTILWYKDWAVEGYATTGSSFQRILKCSHRFGKSGILAKYTPAANTLETNALLLCAVSTNGANNMLLTGTVRVHYID